MERKNCNDYTRFRNLKTLIKTSFNEKIKSEKDLKELAKNSGYSSFEKFLKQITDWLNFQIDIPLGFLSGLELDLERIKQALILDQNEFEAFRSADLTRGYAVIRYMAAIYTKKEIPEELSENEAIAFTENQVKGKSRFVIHFNGLKSIWIEPNGIKNTTYYFTDLKVAKKTLIISGNKPAEHYKDSRSFILTDHLFKNLN